MRSGLLTPAEAGACYTASGHGAAVAEATARQNQAANPSETGAIGAAQEQISKLKGLDEHEKAELKRALPEIVRESPGTPQAASLFRRLLRKTGHHGAKFATQFLAMIACEAAKRPLGL